MSDCTPQRLPYKPDLKEDLAHYYPKIHKLLNFKGLKSLSKKTYAPVRADHMGGKDYCFWAIKLYTEDMIRQFGEGTPVPFHLIEDWAYSQFDDHEKGISTVRAKCRSIWNWYDKRGWVHKIRSYKMSRKDHIKKVHQARSEKTRSKILNAMTGMFSHDFKKKNGKWNTAKIARELNLAVNTVKKYLKEIEDNPNLLHQQYLNKAAEVIS